MLRWTAWAVVVPVALAACSNDVITPVPEPLRCPPGTEQRGDVCVVPCGPGTHEVDGRCAADPPPRAESWCGGGTRLEGTRCVRDDVYVATATATPASVWTRPIPISGAAGGVSLAIDSLGAIFAAVTETSSVVVLASRDGGASFERVFASPLGGHATVVVDREDRIVAVWAEEYPNPSPAFPYRSSSRVLVSSSDDAGRTWAEPRAVDPSGDDAVTAQALPSATVGPDGAVYVSWSFYDDTRYQIRARYAAIRGDRIGEVLSLGAIYSNLEGPLFFDTDGVPFGLAREGASVVVLRAGSRNTAAVIPVTQTYDPLRALAQPDGSVTISYVAVPSFHSGVHTVRSLDDGKTWSAAHRLDGGASPASAVALPAIAADALGRVHVMWLDNRSGGWAPYTAMSSSSGGFLAAERIAEGDFVESGAPTWVGDGNALRIHDDTRFAAWIDARDGTPRAWFARAPLPVPPKGECGRGTRLAIDVCVPVTPAPPEPGATSWRQASRLGEVDEDQWGYQPSFAITAKGVVYLSALIPEPVGVSDHVTVWRSTDDGGTYERLRTPGLPEGATRHRGGSMALDAAERPYVAYAIEGPAGAEIALAGADRDGVFRRPVKLAGLPSRWIDTTRLSFGPSGRARVVVGASEQDAVYFIDTSTSGTDATVQRVAAPEGASLWALTRITDDPAGDPFVVLGIQRGWECDLVTMRPLVDEAPGPTLAALGWTRGLYFEPHASAASARDGTVTVAIGDARSRRFEVDLLEARRVAEGWSAPRRLPTTSGGAVAPAIARDELGRLHVAWFDGSGGGWYLHTAIVGADGTLQHVERVPGIEKYESAQNPDAILPTAPVLAIRGGMRHLAWWDWGAIWTSSSPVP